MLGNLVLNKLALPWTEAERLDALESYGILDTPPEPAFDDIAKLAALTCDAPIALVSLVGKERQWFKSELGIGMRETPRSMSIKDACPLSGTNMQLSPPLPPRHQAFRLMVTGSPGFNLPLFSPCSTR